MTIPHVTNIYPTKGHSGGDSLVRILGGGFAENVLVEFDSAEAKRVSWINHALLYVVTPISPLSAAETGSGAGLVDVKITNLDDNGDPIPSEDVTVVDGFTYVRPTLAKVSDFQRIVAALILELQRQVISEIIIRRHLDYADSAGIAQGKVQISSLPCLVLIGPSTVENRIHGTNEPFRELGERFYIKRRPGLTVDLQFVIIGAANKSKHSLGLQEATLAFFEKNTELSVLRDPDDSSKGYVSYELDFVPGAFPAIAEAPDASNVSSFSGSVAIVGVTIEGFSTIDELPESDFVLGPSAPPPTDGVTFLEIDQLS